MEARYTDSSFLPRASIINQKRSRERERKEGRCVDVLVVEVVVAAVVVGSCGGMMDGGGREVRHRRRG
jgi:hypothetical protein